MSIIHNKLHTSILSRDFYSRHPILVARDLIGKYLIRRINNFTMIGGLIIKTEAYGPPSEDPLVQTEGVRGLRMDWEHGLAWTTYLMRGRPTLNITTIKPSCVLIRAIEPRAILESSNLRETVGPINLAKYLKIDRSMDRTDVTKNGPLFLCKGLSIPAEVISESKRKNVRIDTMEPRRFFVKGCPFVS